MGMFYDQISPNSSFFIENYKAHLSFIHPFNPSLAFYLTLSLSNKEFFDTFSISLGMKTLQEGGGSGSGGEEGMQMSPLCQTLLQPYVFLN
jgi:hypothetical protein